MALSSQASGWAPFKILNSVDAADTAAASSAYVAVSGYEGQIMIVISTGLLDAGSVTYTFSTATDDQGAGAATIVPVGGALTALTTSNDDGIPYVAIFNTSVLLGYIKVIATVVTGGALVSYSGLGKKKYLP